MAALQCIPGCDTKNPRIIRIRNTLQLEYIFVSEALLDEVEANDGVELLSEDLATF